MKIAGLSHSCFPSTRSQIPSISHIYPLLLVSHTRRIIKSEIEIRVCVNRSCRKQGSRETLEIMSGIAPPDVSVNSCGCLGRCGAGPNLVVLPEAVLVSYCGTAARAAEVLARFGGHGDSDDPSKNLEALALRKKAEDELEKGNFSEAEILLFQGGGSSKKVLMMPCFLWMQAIDLKPSGGLHVIYKSRSFARLTMGNNSGALEDANEALKIAPQYAQAYICRGDAFLALEDFDEAEKSYSSALDIDSSIRRSKSFQARVAKLQEKLTVANMLSRPKELVF